MTRLVSAAMAVGLMAASVIAAHAASRSTSPTVKITGAGTLTFVLGGSSGQGTPYSSRLNIGGSTTVSCNQGATYNSANSQATTGLTANFTSVSTTKQVVYVFCMDQYNVRDLRGSGAGWHVTISASPWTCKTTVSKGCTAGTAMGSSIFYMDVPVVSCNTSVEACSGPSTLPGIKMTAASPIDTTTALTVASAALNTGMGVFNFAPRSDQCSSNQQCYTSTGTLVSGSASIGQLDLYPPTTAKTGTYTTTLTESLTTGP
jgi:hypothetical protein